MGLGFLYLLRNIEQAMALLPRFEEGALLVINELVKSPVSLEASRKVGYGRSFSAQGIKEFVNVKQFTSINNPSDFYTIFS